MFTAIDRFREKLRAGKTCIGAAVTFNDPLVAESLADSVDFLWIDTEHTAMNPETLSGHLLAARGRGVPALVRVAGSAASLIKPVLDSGAEGIVVPQVRGAAEVRRVLEDCCYPPMGRRGFGPRVPSNYGRWECEQYVPHANEKLFIAVQIETPEALDELDEILSLPRLDSIVIGPWDLSGALGMLGKVNDPTVLSTIEIIAAKARARGVFVGAGMGPSAEYARTMLSLGVQWLQVGSDFGLMIQTADRLRAAICPPQAPEPTEGLVPEDGS